VLDDVVLDFVVCWDDEVVTDVVVVRDVVVVVVDKVLDEVEDDEDADPGTH
jgi:hypothetical protein